MDWKDLVRTIAPGLATAAGGPAAGLAVKILGDKLLGNPDATEDQVAAVVTAGLTGEQQIALAQGEQQLTLELARISAASDAAALQDTASARAQTVALAHEQSSIAWGAPVVSGLIVAGYFACLFLLFFRKEEMPPNLFQLLNVMFGALQLLVGQVGNYWLGSSAGSKRSTDTVRQIALNGGSKK